MPQGYCIYNKIPRMPIHLFKAYGPGGWTCWRSTLGRASPTPNNCHGGWPLEEPVAFGAKPIVSGRLSWSDRSEGEGEKLRPRKVDSRFALFRSWYNIFAEKSDEANTLSILWICLFSLRSCLSLDLSSPWTRPWVSYTRNHGLLEASLAGSASITL